MSGATHTTAEPEPARAARDAPHTARIALLAPSALSRAPSGHRAAAVASMQRGAGNGAVARMLARETKDEHRAGWEDKPLGGLLYDELIKKYTPEALLKLALPQLSELAKSAPKVDAAGLDAKGSGALAGGAATFAKKAAEEWMASEGGKTFLADAATWVKQHPDAVYWTLLGAMVAAITTAAVLYFTGQIDPPNLEKKFKVLGLSVEAGVDLGKVTEQILQSAKLSVGRDLGGGVTLTLSGDVADKKDKAGADQWSAGTGLKIATKDEKDHLSGKLTYGPTGWGGQFGLGSGAFKSSYSFVDGKDGLAHDGKLTLGAFGAGYLSRPGEKGFEQGSLSFKPTVVPIEATAMVKWGADGTALLDASALYKAPGLGSYTLGLKGPLAGGAPDAPMVFGLGQANKDASGASGSSAWSLSPGRSPAADYKLGIPLGPGIQFDSSFKASDGAITAGTAKLSASALKDAVKAELSYGVDEKGVRTWGASAAIKQEEAAEEVKLAFTDGQLTELALKLSLGAKDDAVRFLVDAALSRNAGIDKATLKGMLTVRASKVVSLAFTAGGSTSDGPAGAPASTFDAGAAFIVKVPKGILLGGSADVAYGPQWDPKAPALGIAPGVIVGHEWSPVMLKGSVMLDPSGKLPPIWTIAPMVRF